MEGPSGEPGQGGRAVAILGQDALSMQVTDACQGRLPGFWFVQWGDVVYLLQRGDTGESMGLGATAGHL